MLKLESRPTDLVRVAKTLMIGVPLAVVAAGFLAPLWVTYDLSVLKPGDTAAVHGYVPNGPAGSVIVETIDGDTATVRAQDGKQHTVPVANIIER